jgi:flagellar assembly protein FliH
MNKPLLLESFDKAGPPGRTPVFLAADIEAARLEGYDAGYRAGWDDAFATSVAEQGRIEEEFARNLRDLSFTFHEARAHVLSGVVPMLRAMFQSLFPALVGEALAARIHEALEADIEGAAHQPVQILVSPIDAAALGRLLVSVETLPCDLREEPTLASGQVYFVLGAREVEVDLTAALEAAMDALDALNDATQKALRHG